MRCSRLRTTRECLRHGRRGTVSQSRTDQRRNVHYITIVGSPSTRIPGPVEPKFETEVKSGVPVLKGKGLIISVEVRHTPPSRDSLQTRLRNLVSRTKGWTRQTPLPSRSRVVKASKGQWTSYLVSGEDSLHPHDG